MNFPPPTQNFLLDPLRSNLNPSPVGGYREIMNAEEAWDQYDVIPLIEQGRFGVLTNIVSSIRDLGERSKFLMSPDRVNCEYFRTAALFGQVGIMNFVYTNLSDADRREVREQHIDAAISDFDHVEIYEDVPELDEDQKGRVIACLESIRLRH